jgi:hypothetical protein
VIEVLCGELRRQGNLLRTAAISGVEEESHNHASDTSASGLWQSGDPGYERLPPPLGRESQAPRRYRPLLVTISPVLREGGEGDDAAIVVRIGNTKIRNPLLLRKDPSSNLERGEPLFMAGYEHDLNPR